MTDELYYIGPDGQRYVAHEGDTIPEGSRIFGGKVDLGDTPVDLPDYYLRQPERLPELNLKAGDEIRAGDAVRFGSDGKVYPVKAKPDSQDIVINGWIIKDDEKPERTGTDFSGLVLPAGDQRVGTALEHGQIDISEDKETPDENTQ
jgi:hypothetical protein